MKRLEFEFLKWKYPESKIWERSRLEQKTRDRIAKAIITWDEAKEKKFRIKYISQKIEWNSKTPLTQEDLQFVLSLATEDLALLPHQPSWDKRYFYCSKVFKDTILDWEVREQLQKGAAKEVYQMIKSGIDEDNVFKYIYIDHALEYISQHDLADILIYNSNFWTKPYWQLDILARRFGHFPKLDPLEIAKKFEAQIWIKGKVYEYGSDPIELLVYNCDHLTPEFEAYLIEKWYQEALKRRKDKDAEEKESKCKEEDETQNTEVKEDIDSWLSEEITRDKWDVLKDINKLNTMFGRFRELASKRYDELN